MCQDAERWGWGVVPEDLECLEDTPGDQHRADPLHGVFTTARAENSLGFEATSL